MNTKRLLVAILLSVLITSGPASTGTTLAQGDESIRTLHTLQDTSIPVRNAPELAQRLGGLIGTLDIPISPAPEFHVGDRQSFYVGQTDDQTIFQVEAELAAASPGVYMWVEDGVEYDAAALSEIAVYLDDDLFPAVRELFGSEATPGIDGDPHIYVLNVTNVGQSIGGYFNDNSVYPRQVFETSNEHEMFVVAVDNIPFDSEEYLYVLAHEFVHMIQYNEDENEETWVSEGTAELGASLTVKPRTLAAQRYLSEPSTIQLNAWDIDNATPYYGAASLFFAYLVERFGPEFTLLHSQEQANGIAGIDNVLKTLAVTDPQTGEVITFADVFADWVVANLLNDTTLADGRFGYTLLDLGSARVGLTASASQYPAILQNQKVGQFSPTYILLESATPQTLAIDFSGSSSVRVVPTDPHSGTHFFWANRSDQSNTRLTRAFDLRGVDSATLSFWAWFEMEPFWDYGYISVSTDDGETWIPLESDITTRENPNNRAFATGITGFSVGGTATRPAPFMGIMYDSSTGTVTELVADGGAAAAGILPGDRIIAIDSVPLQPQDLLQRLNAYYVGDEVMFTLLRDGSTIDLPVTLGAHPERTLRPKAEWMQASFDLTPYTGGEVLVRFEYVTDQAFTRNGWVLDDISIPEIGFFDDMESDTDWNAEGWTRITNSLPQEYLVELIAVTQDGLTVDRLLMPGGGHSGTWSVAVGPNTPAVLIISGMTQYTTQPTTYDLRLTAR